MVGTVSGVVSGVISRQICRRIWARWLVSNGCCDARGSSPRRTALTGAVGGGPEHRHPLWARGTTAAATWTKVGR